ncbi:MAG: DUF4250 domain-containing protein [Clostridia bacterium]|nr:DUF4250 domain-containing protein [Clostridia bacterium]
MNLPADDFILLSLINTKLRDEYSSLEDFCEGEEISAGDVILRLRRAGYEYDRGANAFK